ncbi:MAG: hypothetical protein LUF82_06470 [Clostridia bacterium]|nr:hypothetical protein [Clostridia bacterium]
MTAATTCDNKTGKATSYFVYRLKKCLIPFGIILTVAVIMYLLPMCIAAGSFRSEYYNAAINLDYTFIIVCIAMPVWAFGYKMNKRSTDLYFSLPVKREKLFMVHYITGFLTIIAAYTAVFWVGFIIVVCRHTWHLQAINQLWLYLASVPLLYIIYSLYSFIYTRANNVLDGLLFMLFFTFALMLLSTFAERATSYIDTEYYYDDIDGQWYNYTYRVYRVYPECYLPFAPFNLICELFADRTAGYNNDLFSLPLDYASVNLIVSMCIYVVLSAAATLGMVLGERRSKAENCEQVSESWFGYKVMIPFYAASLCFYITRYTGGIWVYTLLALIIVISYFITAVYKRSLKIGWKQAVILAASIIIGSAIGFIV